MSFTATQYLFKASALTATTTATVGGYIVPASTRGMVLALTISNSATSNITNFCDVGIFDGTNTFTIGGVRTPIYPGGALTVIGIEKHVLPTGGGIYVTAYATTGLNAAATIVEVT